MLTDDGLDLIFRKARTHRAWLDRPVPDALLRQVYELASAGPTSANCSPMRVLCVKSNFLCNLGFGDPGKLPPRAPRLSFDEVCRLI